MPPVAFILKGYPRLSEAFIAQEILALERRGLDIAIYSLRQPTDQRRHALHDDIRAPVRYLPEYLWRQPLRVFAAWWALRQRPAYRTARAAWWRDFQRDPTPNRGRRFGQALVLAHEMPTDITRLHAHFMHTPGSVARYTSLLSGLPFSLSAHAKDIWTIPDWEKREKLEAADWTTTCTGFNARHLSGLAPGADVALVYHGLDGSRFPAMAHDQVRDGSDAKDPLVILAVGRAVEKKGFDVLLEALAGCNFYWRLVHAGGGRLGPLEAQARRLGLTGRIDWLGALDHDRLLELYRGAGLLVLPCRIAKNGDRDGIPNVLMEAMSQGTPAISTNVSAIPELIEDGQTGILVPPDDAAALGRAIILLARDPVRRQQFGSAGAARVASAFAMAAGIKHLAGRFALNSEE